MAIFVVFIIVIYYSGVYGDFDTCCYGESCPLPIFQQFAGDYEDLFSAGIVDKEACCPSGHTSIIKDRFSYTRGGTINNSCKCGYSQTCNFEGNIYGPMCTNHSLMTNISCPDIFIYYTNGCVIGTDSKCDCFYNSSDISTRGMTQRCFDEIICVKVPDPIGTNYIKSGFYNGFPIYINTVEDYYRLLVIINQHNYPEWVLQQYYNYNDSWIIIDYLMDTDSSIPRDFDDPTTYHFATSGNCSMTTSQPTPEPTTTTSSTTYQNRSAGNIVHHEKNTTLSVAFYLVIIGVLLIIGAVVLYDYLWSKREQKITQQNYNQLSINN